MLDQVNDCEILSLGLMPFAMSFPCISVFCKVIGLIRENIGPRLGILSYGSSERLGMSHGRR